MHRSRLFNQRLVAILAVGSAALIAQGTQTANITGTALDESRAPISGAVIRLTSPSLQGVRTLASDEKGRFTARLLPPGNYEIEVTKAGFQTVKIHEKLGLDQNYQPQIVMVKNQGAVVEVIATASVAVDKTDVKTATNYNLDQVDELPTANRTMETLAALSPGVVDSGVGGRIQIRGAMTSGNLFLLDGQNISDATYNNRGISIIEDSVEETQIVTGAISAEYGNVDGGVLNSITRSGSNTFSGQLRWELSNPQWNAALPLQNRTQIANAQSSVYTFSLGGPIIQDKLWFFLSYFRNNANSTGQISGSSETPLALGGAGASYNVNQNEIRKQVKLTYQINQDHTFVAAFMDNTNTVNPRNYSAGSLDSLEHQLTTGGFYSLALRSVWSPSLTSEVRYGQKREVLTAGALNNLEPLYSDASGLFYLSGIFNYNDGGDHRNNRTFNIKVSKFWDAAGSHQTDIGFDFYRGLRHAANMQSNTNNIYEAARIDETNGLVHVPEAVWTYQSDTRQAESDSYGLYINDKWSLNKNFSFQIGLRADEYKAKDTSGSSTVSANGFSPRLGVNYDLFGDSVWLFKASWARYNSGVADEIAGQVTNAGNPTETDYYYTGPTPDANHNVPISVATNIANYTQAANNVAYYSNPTLNVKLASGLKSPHVDESQLSAAYSFKTDAIGTGYVRLTAVWKKWGDLFDYTSGNDGQTSDQYGNTYWWKVYENSSLAQRKYHDLELEAQTELNGWLLNGNVTWSDLEGNYQGEGSSTPMSGQGLAWFTVVNGQQMFDSSINNPYGKLVGDTPLRIRGTLSKVVTTSWGKTTYGFIYRFDSGQHFSYTRSITPDMLNPAFYVYPNNQSGTIQGFGSTSTQYMNNTRGAGITAAQAYLDMAITQDISLGTVARTPVSAFVKLAVQNVLNHQQMVLGYWNFAAAENGLNDPWVSASSRVLGRTDSSSYYGSARTIAVSAGVRF